MIRMTLFSVAVMAFVLGAGAAPAAATAGKKTQTAQPEKLKLVWPDPTPEELALLPKDGCKDLEDIQKPDQSKVSRAVYLAWTRTDDGRCWDWYSRNFDRAYVLGDTPPDERPGRAQMNAPSTGSPRGGHATPEQWMKPPGSHPTPRPR